jgi:cellobiose-specific phosphotransferase system component IIC
MTSSISSCTSKTVAWLDPYVEDHKLRINGFTEFTSCYGTILTVILIVVSCLIFAPGFKRYVYGDYITQVAYGI